VRRFHSLLLFSGARMDLGHHAEEQGAWLACAGLCLPKNGEDQATNQDTNPNRHVFVGWIGAQHRSRWVLLPPKRNGNAKATSQIDLIRPG